MLYTMKNNITWEKIFRAVQVYELKGGTNPAAFGAALDVLFPLDTIPKKK